jgi:hypothetical protein
MIENQVRGGFMSTADCRRVRLDFQRVPGFGTRGPSRRRRGRSPGAGWHRHGRAGGRGSHRRGHDRGARRRARGARGDGGVGTGPGMLCSSPCMDLCRSGCRSARLSASRSYQVLSRMKWRRTPAVHGIPEVVQRFPCRDPCLANVSSACTREMPAHTAARRTCRLLPKPARGTPWRVRSERVKVLGAVAAVARHAQQALEIFTRSQGRT